MVSGPLVGDEASNRFYSRNAQNPNHVIRHSSEQQSLMQQFQGETASFDSSNNGLAEPGNGPRGYSQVGDKVRICLNSKADINGIKWKLMGELEQVRSLVRNLEAKEAQLTEGYGFSQKSDHNLVDNNNNKSTMPFRGIGVCNAENENKVGEGVEKKKRKTPKGDQSSKNLKLPPSGGKKNLGRKSEVGLLLGSDKNSSRLLKSCTTLLEKLMKHKHGWVFNKPVDAKGLGLHDYYKIVKHPMDLGTVKSRLDKNWYKTAAEFAEDVRLTFNNAMLYNPKEQDVHVMAALLLKFFEEKWAAIEDQYNLNRRAEIGNDSEFPTPASRDVEAPAQYNINRRVEMGNISEVPTPMSRKVQGPAHNINRRIGMGNSSELPTPISRKVQAPPPLPSPSPPPLEMRTLDRVESMTKPVDPKLKSASVGHTGRKPVPKKPKARDPDKRDMNMEEKQKLSTDLQALPSEKLANVVQHLVSGFLSDRSEGSVLTATEKTTVLKLQVGLLGLGRELQRDLDRIANTADTSTPEGLSYVLTETTLALIRHPDYCISGCSSVSLKQSIEDAEKGFNQLSIEERGKFDEETLVNVNSIRKRSTTSQRSNGFRNEYIVITILVAAEGVHKLPAINGSGDLKEALQKLASIPRSKLLAVEVSWTPQNENDTLSERELLEDYPLLRPL